MSVRPRTLRSAVAHRSATAVLLVAFLLAVSGGLGLWTGVVAAQSSATATSQDGHGDAHAPSAGEHAEGEHEESLVSFLSRIANFALLVGGLVYFLRKPVSEYLSSRDEQISRDLVTAAELKATATAQLADIDTKLKTLPAELDALKQRGAEEVRTEEARLRADAEKDRARLLEQADREIGMRVQTARRELTELAADLAVASARERLGRETTDSDQLRLIDRYVSQVRTMHE